MTDDFTTDDLFVHATERIVYGYTDPRGFFGPAEQEASMPQLGCTLFPFDAEMRGWELVKKPVYMGDRVIAERNWPRSTMDRAPGSEPGG